MSTVSVIVRTKNAARSIGSALSGLFGQTRHDLDVLVVDSGSTDRTLDIVREYPCRLVQIEARAYLPGAVLNMAVEKTEGEIIVFHNACAVCVGPQTLERLLAPFGSEDVGAAFARQVPCPDAFPWVRRDYEAAFPAVGPAPPWLTLSLPLAAMRRESWQRHPFYTDAYASEDTEWGVWARAHGVKVAYVPDAQVMHSHNYGLRELYGRRFIEGEADAMIYRGKHTVGAFLRRLTRSIAADIPAYARARDVRGALCIPLVRLVYHWAYRQGHRWGERRRDEGIGNVERGQRLARVTRSA